MMKKIDLPPIPQSQRKEALAALIVALEQDARITFRDVMSESENPRYRLPEEINNRGKRVEFAKSLLEDFTEAKTNGAVVAFEDNYVLHDALIAHVREKLLEMWPSRVSRESVPWQTAVTKGDGILR